ncbi:MAG: hypothetical protein L6416_12240 [Candidatus Omnitrophica bacterium]|nr:hypothetical protein [Candidatus Omnitrophota bacterium]
MAKQKKGNMQKTGNVLKKREIDIHYLKMSAYRTYHVDGIFGGITPRGKIYCELFIERNVTPQKITHEVLPDNRVGKETGRDGKQGIVREVECGIILDLDTAISLKDWLDNKINEFNKVFAPVTNKKGER